MPQQIRRSQFVLTYGPGAILESTDGPRIILDPWIGLFGQQIAGRTVSPDLYEINHQRMSQGLLNGTRIFRLPSNAELNLSEKKYIYRTKPFPEWALCVDHNILYRLQTGCPRCTFRKGRREAIRFVRACPEGHLDDVDWDFVVHRGSVKTCRSNWYHWERNGSALRDINIRCPICKKVANLGDAYQRSWPCSGRFPEREHDYTPMRPGCNNQQGSRIIQRQASNLRLPEIVSLFTIPPRHTALHRLLENTAISSILVVSPPATYEELQAMLETLLNRRMISRTTADEILRYPWPEIQKAIKDIQTPIPTSFRDLLLEEFHELINASVFGVSAIRDSKLLFEVIKDNVYCCRSSSGRLFRIAPVSRLNTVIVQLGYRRLIGSVPEAAALVDISFRDQNQNKWLPGVEFLGEGVFIMLDENEGWHFPMSGEAFLRWLDVYYNRSGDYNDILFRFPEQKDELHPVFVWWHTLAHLLIRTLAVNSGYSSSSIRERIYLEIDQSGRARGGILLYTVQPGADGTLGGLVSIIRHFGSILTSIKEEAEKCSNNPLCEEQKFTFGNCIGAACYGCILVSETSCEHRNMWLDRHILTENQP
ncbi:hypothetical protein MTCOM_05740 [Moorella thermoacetica]|uniref:DUF1998 domain-containing protein n=1 Tax=Neomoorella thermoacetica TaxID=1525 RepID=UPI0008FACC09|nr:DUF1998 domain-containing protein [Moorella thermoacetica]OIQ10639.1 hypothetical protein MOOTH_24760 [Moorella thermoacetica]